jgi:hypothetical protein
LLLPEEGFRTLREANPSGRWDSDLLASVCEAVIAAAGPLPLSTIVAVVGQLLGVLPPSMATLTEGQGGIAVAAGSVASPGPARQIALDVWEKLTDRERLLLPHLADSARRQGEAIAMGHSQAPVVAGRLRKRLRIVLDGEPETSQTDLLAHLLDLCEDRTEQRQESPDS